MRCRDFTGSSKLIKCFQCKSAERSADKWKASPNSTVSSNKSRTNGRRAQTQATRAAPSASKTWKRMRELFLVPFVCGCGRSRCCHRCWPFDCSRAQPIARRQHVIPPERSATRRGIEQREANELFSILLVRHVNYLHSKLISPSVSFPTSFAGA